MKKILKVGTVLGLSAVLFASCATKGDLENLRTELDQKIEEKFTSLQGKLERTSNTASGIGNVKSIAEEAKAGVQEVKSELSALKGKVDENSQKIDTVNAKIDSLKVDIENLTKQVDNLVGRRVRK
ncbi:MAG: hypothetical protein DSY60_00155 [Persephonella sp.]|nr:MAG: hypothetical protein DSY60_00155 [Persephonella sp.]